MSVIRIAFCFRPTADRSAQRRVAGAVDLILRRAELNELNRNRESKRCPKSIVLCSTLCTPKHPNVVDRVECKAAAASNVRVYVADGQNQHSFRTLFSIVATSAPEYVNAHSKANPKCIRLYANRTKAEQIFMRRMATETKRENERKTHNRIERDDYKRSSAAPRRVYINAVSA